mmetsp:Transcript_65891/g.201785  ORF Transcript_65891/g.201785 Transcript_65891/m.201785 type:complete len:223 (+) Transcript_65891:258-926(+)
MTSIKKRVCLPTSRFGKLCSPSTKPSTSTMKFCIVKATASQTSMFVLHEWITVHMLSMTRISARSFRISVGKLTCIEATFFSSLSSSAPSKPKRSSSESATKSRSSACLSMNASSVWLSATAKTRAARWNVESAVVRFTRSMMRTWAFSLMKGLRPCGVIMTHSRACKSWSAHSQSSPTLCSDASSDLIAPSFTASSAMGGACSPSTWSAAAAWMAALLSRW